MNSSIISSMLIMFVSKEVLSEQYIVSVKPHHYQSVKSRLFGLSKSRAFEVEDVQINQFYGFIGDFDQKTLKEFESHNGVNYVEKDGIMSIQILRDVKDIDTQFAPLNWGLPRISSRQKQNSTSITKLGELKDSEVPEQYTYYRSAGSNVDVYIIDTGINANHIEFEGRAKFLKNFVNDDIDTDENGHGTHVSGIIGSKSFGVCKKCNLFGVKVLGTDGSGSTSGIIKAIQYVVEQSKANKNSKGSVINMSLGGGFSKALNDAVEQAYLSNVPVVVAAGNENSDACTTSPASSNFALSVGNTDIVDDLHYSSNYGKCVEINAPGTNILSTYKDTIKVLTGTSMASPHVTGVVALFLGELNSVLNNTKSVYDLLIKSSTPNQVITTKNTPKNILYNKML